MTPSTTTSTLAAVEEADHADQADNSSGSDASKEPENLKSASSFFSIDVGETLHSGDNFRDSLTKNGDDSSDAFRADFLNADPTSTSPYRLGSAVEVPPTFAGNGGNGGLANSACTTAETDGVKEQNVGAAQVVSSSGSEANAHGAEPVPVGRPCAIGDHGAAGQHPKRNRRPKKRY